jgi:hypothetical protein
MMPRRSIRVWPFDFSFQHSAHPGVDTDLERLRPGFDVERIAEPGTVRFLFEFLVGDCARNGFDG